MQDPLVEISKFLSFVLRHKPDAIGLSLDENGWATLDELIAKAHAHGNTFTEVQVREVVASNDKQRFILDETNRRVRANQGHSVQININLEAALPPPLLYHPRNRS